MSTLMSLSNHFYCLSLTCFLVIGQVSSSFSDGITSESCYSLHQSSGNGTVIPPILCDSGACNGLRLNVIGVSDGYYTCDSEYEVKLSSNRNFMGYIIQARVPLPGQPFHTYRIVGTIVSPGTQGTVLYCNSTADSPEAPPSPNSAIQNGTISVRSVTVTWKAPPPFIAQGNIQFFAAVIEDYDHYYLPITSEIMVPLPNSCDSYLPFLSLGITAGVETQELPRLDDWASDAIPVPTGFPFATYNHTSFYIGTNGVFSFGYPETGYWHHISSPTRFYAAPFWGDVNTEEGGDIYYEIHTTPSLLIDQVCSFVSSREGIQFSATWMMVAFWDRVHQYGSGFQNVTLQPLGNTFQGILLTDGVKSFMVSTFKNQSMSWYNSDVRIGYMGDTTHSMFGPLDNSTFSSLFIGYHGDVLYYNEIYQLSIFIDGVRLTMVQPVLIYMTVQVYSDITHFSLSFDLAVNASSCDTTQVYLQTSNGAVTFRPLYDGICASNDGDYYFGGQTVLEFLLHSNDHIRFLSEPYNELLASNNAVVSIGTNLVRTAGNTGVTPVYFMDQMNVDIYNYLGSVSIRSFHLDMINAEFHIEFNHPVISDSNYITLYCDTEQNETATIDGLWSTAQSIEGRTILSLRMSPYSFAKVCSLSCLEYDYVKLDYFSPFMDIFGSEITSYQYQHSSVSVNGPDMCSLGLYEQDPVERNFTLNEQVLLGPLRLYLRVSTMHNPLSSVLYPLKNNEVYLPDCLEANVTIVSVDCLRLSHATSNPQIAMTEGIVVTSWNNTSYSARALYAGGQTPRGTFICNSTGGYVATALFVSGVTYFSTSGPSVVFLGLGSFLNAHLTIAMCPRRNPRDVLLTNSSGSRLVGLSFSNTYQNFYVEAGPLYLEDATNVHVRIPTATSFNSYLSVFSIMIEAPSARAFTTGSATGTIVVAVPSYNLVSAAMTCQLEDQYTISVIWIVYPQQNLPYQVLDQHTQFLLTQNGQNLEIDNMFLPEFLSSVFECRMLTSPSSNGSIQIANFTTVEISDTIVISTEPYIRNNGSVFGSFPNNTIISSSALSSGDVFLPCYGASGYGDVKWRSTLPHMLGYLSQDSFSPYYSLVYNGSVSILTLYGHSNQLMSGSLTCYSEEAGSNNNNSVTIHITNDALCLCSNIIPESTYPLSLCQNTSTFCNCPEGYIGDGVFCALDSDGDTYTDVDMSLFHYCQPYTDNILCYQDICPHLYNPAQSPDVLESSSMTGVFFEVNGRVLPNSLIIGNASNIESIRCLGTEGNIDITVQLFETVNSNSVSRTLETEICQTEAKIYLQLNSDFLGALHCHSSATGHSTWLYFTTEACVCTTSNERDLPDYVLTCKRAGIESCDCSDTECECVCGYTGDGRICAVDGDNDGYPDHSTTDLCAGQELQSYCTEDTCPVDYDPRNDPGACEQLDTTDSVCASETDSTWLITWSDTRTGYYDTQSCPSSQANLAAYAFRLCELNGIWSDFVDTSCCKDLDFEIISNEFEEIFQANFTNETSSQITIALADLVEATTPPEDRSSLYAQDLETTNDILKETIEFLRTGVENNLLDQLHTEVVQVIDNVLEESNTDGWSQLTDTAEGAEQLLDSVELYGTYIVEAIASPNVDVSLDDGKLVLNASFNNIYISATVQDPFSADDVVFPVEKEDFTLEPVFDEPLAHIKIPARLLETRANESNSSRVFAVNMVIENINDLLLINGEVFEINGTNYTTRAVTQLIVGQVIVHNNTDTASSIQDIPVQLVFVTEQINNNSQNPRCVYYDFDRSEWLDDGVTTDNVTTSPDGRSYHVVCTTKHFTSFAVLVDVSDVEMDIPPSEAYALTLLTYIGCGISVVCLTISILFYITYGKTLFTSVHYFVHLNLAVALFLGYIVFVLGTQFGTECRIICGVVAGALHYLFLSVFCWMMCEGIMLYLMLVLVFSTLSKKWWLFFIIGWGLPVVVVAVTAGLKYNEYGDPERGFCWISVDSGLIWAFVGPMLAIILLNILFLCTALRSLYRVTAGKFNEGQDKKPLVKKLVMAAIILLPILGVTWAFGLLTVNRDTTVFTWLFTIFNSLQGLFFFIFHVIRSDRMWNSIMRCLPGERKDKRGRSLTRRTTQTSVSDRSSLIMNTLKKKKRKESELSSDAVIVLGNPMATGNNPFGTKKDVDLGLSSTVLMY